MKTIKGLTTILLTAMVGASALGYAGNSYAAEPEDVKKVGEYVVKNAERSKVFDDGKIYSHIIAGEWVGYKSGGSNTVLQLDAAKGIDGQIKGLVIQENMHLKGLEAQTMMYDADGDGKIEGAVRTLYEKQGNSSKLIDMETIDPNRPSLLGYIQEKYDAIVDCISMR